MAINFKIIINNVEPIELAFQIKPFLTELTAFDIGNLIYCFWDNQLTICFYEHDDEHNFYLFLQKWFKNHHIKYDGLERYK